MNQRSSAHSVLDTRRAFGKDISNLGVCLPSQILKPPTMQVQEHHQTDPQTVPSYRNEILGYLLQTDRAQLINYFEFQPDIRENMRSILIQWLNDLHHKMKLLPQTFFLAVSLLDRFLTMQLVSRSELQLAGVTALLVASKFQQTYRVPSIKDLAYACADTYSRQDIISMQSKYLNNLSFQIHSASPFAFLNLLVPLVHLDNRNYHLCWYILELAQLDFSFSQQKPSMQAISTLYLVNKIRKRASEHNQRLMRLTVSCQTKVRSLAKRVSQMLLHVQQNAQAGKIREKFGEEQHDQVSSIRIQRTRR